MSVRCRPDERRHIAQFWFIPAVRVCWSVDIDRFWGPPYTINKSNRIKLMSGGLHSCASARLNKKKQQIKNGTCWYRRGAQQQARPGQARQTATHEHMRCMQSCCTSHICHTHAQCANHRYFNADQQTYQQNRTHENASYACTGAVLTQNQQFIFSLFAPGLYTLSWVMSI